MEKPVENYWNIRLSNLKERLIKNNFEVFMADTVEDAGQVVRSEIRPRDA